MDALQPAAIGSLETTPLLHLLIYVLDHELTGTLVLEQPDAGEKHAICFTQGRPSKAKTGRPIAYLGQTLAATAGILEADLMRTLVEAQASGELHGQVLKRAGIIDQPILTEGLREQLARQLVFLAGLSGTTLYGYYDRVDLLETWGAEGVRSRPLNLIWRVIQAQSAPPGITAILARIEGRPLLLHSASPIGRFRFATVEQAIVDLLRAKPQPLEELLARDMADRARVERLVYALVIMRQLDLGFEAAPFGVDEPPSSIRPAATPKWSAPSTRSPAPPALPPELSAFREDLYARAARCETDTLYQVLGLQRNAGQGDVQSSFIELVKTWHPDRLPSQLSPLRELATSVFSRMAEANRVLGDPVLRREYDSQLRRARREAEEQEQVQKALRAATAFQKAEVLLKRRKLTEAETEARLALAEDSSQADYVALVAWLEAQKPDANLDAAIKTLDRAIQLQPNNVRAHWYRGQLNKRAGRMNRAMRDFRAVLECEPRHVDAHREIRLFLMRRGDRATSVPPSADEAGRRASPVPQKSSDRLRASDLGGLIGKLFKR